MGKLEEALEKRRLENRRYVKKSVVITASICVLITLFLALAVVIHGNSNNDHISMPVQ